MCASKYPSRVNVKRINACQLIESRLLPFTVGDGDYVA